MDIAVVIASNREPCMKRWLAEWQADLGNTKVIVVEDNPETSFDLDTTGYADLEHYAWSDIEKDLKDSSWIIPRRTSAIKSYGFWKAHQEGADAIWALDDDCYPEKSYREFYLKTMKYRLTREVPQTAWWSTLHGEYMPRGFPYDIREVTRPVMVHHGLWSGIPDLDGLTAAAHPDYRTAPALGSELVPAGAMFPMCGMNLAFRRDVTPAMYFMLMGSDATEVRYPYDRFDDIWAGLLAKRVCDQLNWAVTSGSPSIVHTKESDPATRIAKEAPGIIAHEKLWPVIANAWLPAHGNAAGYTRALASHIRDAAPNLPGDHGYWQQLAYAITIWADLF